VQEGWSQQKTFESRRVLLKPLKELPYCYDHLLLSQLNIAALEVKDHSFLISSATFAICADSSVEHKGVASDAASLRIYIPSTSTIVQIMHYRTSISNMLPMPKRRAKCKQQLSHIFLIVLYLVHQSLMPIISRR